MYIKHDVMFFLHFLVKSIRNCAWLINLADYYNLLGPGTWVSAAKSNNFADETLQA